MMSGDGMVMMPMAGGRSDFGMRDNLDRPYPTEEYLEPTTLTRRQGREYTRNKPLHDSGVVDMDMDHEEGLASGTANGHAVRDYPGPSGPGRWSGQSGPTSPESPPPSYKSNYPSGSSPVEDYTAPVPYNNEYEELPNTRYNNPNYKYHEISGVPENRVPVSAQMNNNSTEKLCHMSNNTDKPQLPTFRKRQNPLYDEKEHGEGKVEKRAATGAPACLYWLLVAISLLALTAFILVILDLAGVIGKSPSSSSPSTGSVIYKENSSDVSALLQRFHELEQKYAQLEQVAANYSKLKTLLEQQGGQLTLIENRVQGLTGNMSAFNSSVQQQISNVQKMPGPPGPTGPKGDAGAGNMSLCRHRDLSHGSSTNSPFTQTPWTPEADELKLWVILGLECTTNGGDTALLLTQQHPADPNKLQYKCECRGATTGASSRYCYLHVFECPLLS